MNFSARQVAAGVAASFAFAAIPAAASTVDWFLKLDKIDGESTDDKHKGEIELTSWSWGVAQGGGTGNGAGNGGGHASKPCVADLAITKGIDKSTPQLIGRAATGLRVASGVLVGRKAGKDQQEFLKLTLKDILVSSYQTSGGGAGTPTEAISLGFASVTVEYKEQKADGSLGNAVSVTVTGGC